MPNYDFDCSINPAPGKRRGTAAQCIKTNQVTYYGKVPVTDRDYELAAEMKKPTQIKLKSDRDTYDQDFANLIRYEFNPFADDYDPTNHKHIKNMIIVTYPSKINKLKNDKTITALHNILVDYVEKFQTYQRELRELLAVFNKYLDDPKTAIRSFADVRHILQDVFNMYAQEIAQLQDNIKYLISKLKGTPAVEKQARKEAIQDDEIMLSTLIKIQRFIKAMDNIQLYDVSNSEMKNRFKQLYTSKIKARSEACDFMMSIFNNRAAMLNYRSGVINQVKGFDKLQDKINQLTVKEQQLLDDFLGTVESP